MPEDIDQLNAQHKRSFWEHHLERWRQTGLSQRAYCQTHHLKPNQFYYWRRRILQPASEISFLSVKMPAEPVCPPDPIRVLMPNGFAIELQGCHDPDQLRPIFAMVAAL